MARFRRINGVWISGLISRVVPASLAHAAARIRADRVLHEALTAGPDPLHLALVFNLSHTTASSYAAIAQNLLDDHPE